LEGFPNEFSSLTLQHPIDNALGSWGTSAHAFSSEVRAAYIDALRDPARVHAICEEYRAAATIDHEHDLADREAARRIICPVLVLWSDRGPLNSWYADAGALGSMAGLGKQRSWQTA
jgi:haloacetate dehalogenase